jgi:hypothetical protein
MMAWATGKLCSFLCSKRQRLYIPPHTLLDFAAQEQSLCAGADNACADVRQTSECHPDRRRCCGTGTAGLCASRLRTGPAWSSHMSSCCAAATQPCRTRRQPPWGTTGRHHARRDSGRRRRSWATCTCPPAAACSCGRRYVSGSPVSGLLSGLRVQLYTVPAVSQHCLGSCAMSPNHDGCPFVTVAPCASQQHPVSMYSEAELSCATTYIVLILGAVCSKQVGKPRLHAATVSGYDLQGLQAAFWLWVPLLLAAARPQRAGFRRRAAIMAGANCQFHCPLAQAGWLRALRPCPTTGAVEKAGREGWQAAGHAALLTTLYTKRCMQLVDHVCRRCHRGQHSLPCVAGLAGGCAASDGGVRLTRHGGAARLRQISGEQPPVSSGHLHLQHSADGATKSRPGDAVGLYVVCGQSA